MSQIFRSHLPYCQAHILAGVLSSGGIPATVAGDMVANIYGEIPVLDCVVMVHEDQVEEAEAFLCADFIGEAPDQDIPTESCPRSRAHRMATCLILEPFFMAQCVSHLWQPSFPRYCLESKPLEPIQLHHCQF